MPHEATAGMPDSLTVGDTWRWTRTVSGHSPADGWTLKYKFSPKDDPGELALTVEATADGSGFLVDIPAADTEGLASGPHRWVEYVEKGDERFSIAYGIVPFDSVLHESHAARMVRKILAAIEDITEGRIQQANINSRGRTLISLDDLYRGLRHWEAVLEQEQHSGFGPQVAARMQAPGFTHQDVPFPFIRGFP